MKKQTAQHTQIYPKDSDGHPLAAGYGVIARAVYDAMQHPLNIKYVFDVKAVKSFGTTAFTQN
jgi:hypothetical protein